MRPRRSAWLLALAILCAIASYAIDRFGHELCHQGLPLAVLAVGTPFVGMFAGVAALFHRLRIWLHTAQVAATAINAYQLFLALSVLKGVGYLSCGA